MALLENNNLKYLGGKTVDLRRFVLVAIFGKTGLKTGLFEKSSAVPVVFHGNLR
jgi:hypothetical protein